MEQDNKSSIFYKIDKNFAYNFNVLQDIKVTNRKSDTGFSDEDKLMITMRDGTSRLGNEIIGGEGTSGLYLFTDFFGVKHKVRGYNNIVYFLSSTNIWNSISSDLGGNDFHFNTIKLPLNIDGSTPTEYITPTDGTLSEAVPVSTLDTTPINNVGKILFITTNSGDNQVYRGCFGTITAYDSGSNQYILGDSGILGTSMDKFVTVTGIASGSRYQIYDTLGEHLQVSNGVSLDRYFFVQEDLDVLENTKFQGLVTYNLRNIKAISSTQFLIKQISYSNAFLTYNKGTLYQSRGNVNNPFFHTYLSAITLPGIKGGNIIDLFVFKKRLIIAGDTFCGYIAGLETIQFEFISNKYGMKENSLNDLGVDAYFLSNDKQLYSLAETISGTLLATNVGKQVNNYIKNFNTRICSGFSGRYLFLYGQIDNDTEGVIVVLDILYKFWSIYTGLRPSSIVSENGIIYLTDNNSDIVRYFDGTVYTDVANKVIKQKIEFNEIYFNDIFSDKTLSDIYIWLDNFTQDLNLDIFMAFPSSNSRKKRINIKYLEENVEAENLSLGLGDLGENILGGNGYEKDISFPFMKRIQLDCDSANIFKIILTGKDGSPFYLNEFSYNISYKTPERARSYFSTENTI